MTETPTVEEMQDWNKRFRISKEDNTRVIDSSDKGEFWTVHGNEAYNLCILMNQLHEENEEMKKKGLDVLRFYQEKLKNTTNHDDFQSVRDEIWIVKQVLLEMGVVND